MIHRCCVELNAAEMKAVLAAVEREGRGELSVAWMKRVVLERANSFNLQVWLRTRTTATSEPPQGLR